jgi:hypothetical protein
MQEGIILVHGSNSTHYVFPLLQNAMNHIYTNKCEEIAARLEEQSKTMSHYQQVDKLTVNLCDSPVENGVCDHA